MKIGRAFKLDKFFFFFEIRSNDLFEMLWRDKEVRILSEILFIKKILNIVSRLITFIYNYKQKRVCDFIVWKKFRQNRG